MYNEAVYNTGADCGSILLFDLEDIDKDQPKIAFHVGDAANGTLLNIEQMVVKSGEPLIIPNFAHSHFDPPHPGIGTALIVPIAFQDNTVGLVHMHARTPQRFDQESIEIAQTLAVQAAIALLADRYRGQSIVAVTHGGVLDSVYRIAAGLPMQAPRKHELLNASLNTIGWDGQAYSLIDWGDVRHLDDSQDDVQVAGP